MMPNMKGSKHPGLKLALIVGFLGLFLFACQLPAQILDRVRNAEPTPITIQSSTPSPTKADKKPVPVTPTGVDTLPTDSQYPSDVGTEQATAPSNITAYPDTSSETTEQATIMPTDNYPASSQTPAVQQTSSDTYPSFAQNTTYPGNETPEGSDNTYPVTSASPTVETQSPQFTATMTPSPQAQITATPSSTTSGTAARTATRTVTSNANAQSETPIPTVPPRVPTQTATFFVPPPTAIPTATRFLTPTPTLTFTPTPTRTPLPFPPWLSVQIFASDPAEVRLAAGKPQLIMFFAYWSGPSLAMAPIVKGVEKEYLNRVNFIYLDIDNPLNAALKQSLRYKSEPHFFLIDENGKVLQDWIGYVGIEELRAAIENSLK